MLLLYLVVLCVCCWTCTAQNASCDRCEDAPVELMGPVVAVTSTEWATVSDLDFNLSYYTTEYPWPPAIIFKSANINCQVEVKFVATTTYFRAYLDGRNTTWDYLVMGLRPLGCCGDYPLNGTLQCGISSVSNHEELALYPTIDFYGTIKFNMTYRQLCSDMAVTYGFPLQSPTSDGTPITLYANNSNFLSYSILATALYVIPPPSCGIQLELTSSHSIVTTGSCGRLYYRATYLFPTDQVAIIGVWVDDTTGGILTYRANCSSVAMTLTGLHVTPHRMVALESQLGWQTFNIGEFVDSSYNALNVLVISCPETDGHIVTSLDGGGSYSSVDDSCVVVEPGSTLLALVSYGRLSLVMKYRYYSPKPMVLSAPNSFHAATLQLSVHTVTSYRVLIQKDISFPCAACIISATRSTGGKHLAIETSSFVFPTGVFGSAFNTSFDFGTTFESFPNTALAIQFSPFSLDHYAANAQLVFGIKYGLRKPKKNLLNRLKWSSVFQNTGTVSVFAPLGSLLAETCWAQIVVLQNDNPQFNASIGCSSKSLVSPKLQIGELINVSFSDCPIEDIVVYFMFANAQFAGRFICKDDQVDPGYLYLADVIGTPLPVATASRWQHFELLKSPRVSDVHRLWTIRAANPTCQVQLKFSDIELSGTTITEGRFVLGEVDLTNPPWFRSLTGDLLNNYGQKGFSYISCAHAVLLFAPFVDFGYANTIIVTKGEYRQVCDMNVTDHCGEPPYLTTISAMMNEWRTYQLVAVNFNQARRSVLRILAPSIDSVIEVKFSQVNTMLLEGQIEGEDGLFYESQIRGTWVFPTSADAESFSAYGYNGVYASPQRAIRAHLGAPTEFNSSAVDVKARGIAQPQDIVYTVNYRARLKNETTNNASLVATHEKQILDFSIPDMSHDRVQYLKQLKTPVSGSSARGQMYPIWAYKGEWILRPSSPQCQVALTVVDLNVGNGNIRASPGRSPWYPSLLSDQNRLRIVLNSGSDGVYDVDCGDIRIPSVVQSSPDGSYCALGNVTFRGGIGQNVTVTFQSWYAMSRIVETTWGPGEWTVQYWQDCDFSVQGPSILATGVKTFTASATPVNYMFPPNVLEHMEYCDLRWRIQPEDSVGNVTHVALVSMKLRYGLSPEPDYAHTLLSTGTSMEDTLTSFQYHDRIYHHEGSNRYYIGSVSPQPSRWVQVGSLCIQRSFFKLVSIKYRQVYAPRRTSQPTQHPVTAEPTTAMPTSSPNPTVNRLLPNGWSCDSGPMCLSGICSRFLRWCTATSCAAACATKSTQATCLSVSAVGCSCTWVSSKCVPL